MESFAIVAAELRSLSESESAYPLPSSDDISTLEQALGQPLHGDFRRYLLQLSDVVYGSIEPVVASPPTAHNYLLTISDRAWRDAGVPPSLIPICYDNADYYCVTADGRVVFWSHDTNGLSGEEWASVASWIKAVWIEEQKY